MKKDRKLGLFILLAGVGYLYFQTILHQLGQDLYGPGLEFVLRFANVDVAEYIRRYILTNSYYPPLYFVFLLVVHLPFGMAFLPYILADALFVAGGAIFLYLYLARRTEEWAAGAAGAAYLLLPGICFFTKTLAIEQPFMLLIPLTIYLLDQSNALSRKSTSIQLGLVAGLGMLTKWTYAAYTVCFFIYYLSGIFKRVGSERRSSDPSSGRLANLAFFLVTALVVAGPWYFGVMDFDKFIATANNDPTYPEFHLWNQFTHNIDLLLSLTGRWVLLFVVFASVAAVAFSKSRIRVGGLAVAVLVPLFLFSLPRHLEDRYIYPLCIMIPLLAVSIMPNAKRKARLVLYWAALGAVILATNTIAFYSGMFVRGPLRTNAIYENGRLAWGDIATSRILDEVASDSRQRFPAKTSTIAVHPLWFNLHCDNLIAMYLLSIDPEYDLLKLEPYAKFRYLDFSRSLRDGGLDYLVVGCEIHGVCSHDPAPQVHLRDQDLMRTDYLEQRYGFLFEKYTEEDVLSDLVYLRANYEVMAKLRLDEINRVWIYAGRAGK